MSLGSSAKSAKVSLFLILNLLIACVTPSEKIRGQFNLEQTSKKTCVFSSQKIVSELNGYRVVKDETQEGSLVDFNVVGQNGECIGVFLASSAKLIPNVIDDYSRFPSGEDVVKTHLDNEFSACESRLSGENDRLACKIRAVENFRTESAILVLRNWNVEIFWAPFLIFNNQLFVEEQ